MNRSKILLSLVGLLSLIWLGLWISSWWGTITLDYENKPLSAVLRSFTNQSKLKVITDLDLTKPITIHVRRVPVSEALEALQASAESRGRLAILFAPDAASMKNLLSALPTPTENSGILSIEYSTPWLFRGGIDNLPIERDPRNQIWTPSPQLPLQLLPLLEHAAQTTEVRLLLPQSWNPNLKNHLPPALSPRPSLPLPKLQGASPSSSIFFQPDPNGKALVVLPLPAIPIAPIYVGQHPPPYLPKPSLLALTPASVVSPLPNKETPDKRPKNRFANTANGRHSPRRSGTKRGKKL